MRDAATAGVPDAHWVVFRSADEAAVLGGVALARSRARWVGTEFERLLGSHDTRPSLSIAQSSTAV